MKQFKFLILVFIASQCFTAESEAITSQEKTTVVNLEKQTEPVEETLKYFDMGFGPAPIPLPDFGFGFRHQKNKWGYDLNFDLSTIYYVTQVKITPSVLYYNKPNLSSQFYSGLGLATGCLFTNKISHDWDFSENSAFIIAPELIFGKKYKNENGSDRFFQVNIDWPTYSFQKLTSEGWAHSNILYVPVVYLKYGVAF